MSVLDSVMSMLGDTDGQVSPVISVRRVPFDQPWEWLGAGWRDMWTTPLPSLMYGVAFALGAVLYHATTGELPFTSPEVKNAAETLAEIWFKDGYVYGGTAGIVSTFFGDSPAPMFEDPPKCWMHKQGNFITGFFPEGAEADVDYGFFYLPPIDPAYGKPFLVAGDIMAMFNDRPEVRALMEYFTVPQSAKGWLETGGALAASDGLSFAIVTP